MRYMLMICDDESGQVGPPADVEADPRFRAWGEEMGRRGVLRGGGRLRPSSDATTVRVRDDEVLLPQGFVSSGEPFGSPESNSNRMGLLLVVCKAAVG